MVLTYNHTELQKLMRKIVKKAANPRACELRWGTVASQGATRLTMGSVTVNVLYVYLDGQGNSATSLGNAIAANAVPIPVAQLTTEVFCPGERVVLLKVGADSRTGGSQYMAVGKLPNQPNNVIQSGNVEITSTSTDVTLFDFTPAHAGLYQANLYLRTSASTTCVAVGQSVDERGYSAWYFQAYTSTNVLGFLDGITLAANTSYSCVPMIIRCETGYGVSGYIDCGTANAVYASWAVTPLGAN